MAVQWPQKVARAPFLPFLAQGPKETVPYLAGRESQAAGPGLVVLGALVEGEHDVLVPVVLLDDVLAPLVLLGDAALADGLEVGGALVLLGGAEVDPCLGEGGIRMRRRPVWCPPT